MVRRLFKHKSNSSVIGNALENKAVEVERAPGEDGLERAKHKLLAAITQQIENVRNPGQLNECGKPIRDWSFRDDDDGKLYIHIRFGTRPMEFPTARHLP